MKRKNWFASLFAFIFLFITLFSFSSYAYPGRVDIESNPVLAEETSQQLSNVITSIKQNPNVYEYTSEEINNAYLGQQFQITDLQASYDKEELFYYPIICGSEVIGIVSIIYSEGHIISVTAGRSFADALNEILSSQSQNVRLAFYCDDSGIWAINESGKVFVIFDNPNIQQDTQKNTRNIYLNSTAYIPVNTLYQKNQVFSLNKLSSSPRAAQKDLVNYPIVAQGGDPLCWAASLASILRFEVPSQYSSITARQVADKVGHDISGAWSYEVRDYMAQLMPSVYKPTYINSTLGFRDIMVIINNVDPLYIAAWAKDGGGHAVVICGYNLWNTGFTVRLMNPGTARFESMSLNTETPSFSYNGRPFYWGDCVRLLY